VGALAGSLLGAGLAFLAFALLRPVIFLSATLAVGLCASVGLTLATLAKVVGNLLAGVLVAGLGYGAIVGVGVAPRFSIQAEARDLADRLIESSWP